MSKRPPVPPMLASAESVRFPIPAKALGAVPLELVTAPKPPTPVPAMVRLT